MYIHHTDSSSTNRARQNSTVSMATSIQYIEPHMLQRQDHLQLVKNKKMYSLNKCILHKQLIATIQIPYFYTCQSVHCRRTLWGHLSSQEKENKPKTKGYFIQGLTCVGWVTNIQASIDSKESWLWSYWSIREVLELRWMRTNVMPLLTMLLASQHFLSSALPPKAWSRSASNGPQVKLDLCAPIR